MKIPALQQFREKLAANEPVYGLWVTLESASITEMAVALGLDWVVIDAEHGHLDWRDILEHIRATVRSNTVALVRVAEVNIGLIKRSLDIGADGVVVPWIESAKQLTDAVAYAHYPPEGLRGIGAERATCWGQCFAEHAEQANEKVLVVPIIESVKGGANIAQLLNVDGIEVFFFGPADYSSTAGYPGQWEGPGVAEQILATKDAIRAQCKHCGVVATGNENLIERREQGFGMIGLGLDGGLMVRSLHNCLETVGRDTKITPTFTSENTETVVPTVTRPPESMRPDRLEVMNSLGTGPKAEVEAGVTFEILVGTHNNARNLTTGFATFKPRAQIPYHQHPFGESATLISGRMVIEVEGRRYELQPLDNITIPHGVPHTGYNPSPNKPAVLHAILGTDTPSRELIDQAYPQRTMPDSASGCPGMERVTRFSLARRYEAGPHISFIDFFNENLLPGIGMSGGYGLFHPTGRLPAHLHDFDESICIIEGNATCLVEGRRYTLSDYATALQPRGRVHYFANETDQTMAMIWAYASPLPLRMVVHERCATPEGDPWKQ